MEPGTEATVTCEADEFYPKDITFQWIKYQRGSGNVPLQKGVSYTHPIDNKDGTFNQSSFLRINPTLEDNGNVYSCNVSHRSMGTDLQLNITLSVTEKKTGSIIGAITATLAVAIISIGIGILGCMILKKEPPKLSPITGAEHLVHMNEATLSCQISGFRPKPIRITLCLQRNGGEVMEIYSWDSEAQTGSAAPVAHHGDEQRVVIAPEREGLMGNGNVQYLPPAQRALRVEMVPVIKTSKSHRISNCQCTIRITPDIEEDDGAELTVRVTHSALRGPISKSCRLEVRGVKPNICKIVSPLRILQGESLTLTCPIYGFKPKPLSVTWLKVDSGGQETELLCWDRGTTDIRDPKYLHELAENEKQEGEEEDHLNYFLSNVTLKPTVRGDHGAQYVCRTHHYATGERAEKRMEMQVLAVPQLDPIQTSSDIIPVGKEIKLSCRIHSFYPQPLNISWYKEDEILISTNTQIIPEDNGLFHGTSCITYRPSVRDIGKSFRCEVSHESLQHPKCVSWELKHLEV
uniref:Ig-like domain-containing protein n=1 Tax=Xenopus tropicalis TaxID=8364 RepID=A0A803K484_XENTR